MIALAGEEHLRFQLNFKRLAILALVANVILASFAVALYWQNTVLTSQIAGLTKQVDDLIKSSQALKQENELIRSQLLYYKEQADYYSSLIRSGNATEGVVGVGLINIVAVRQVITGLFTTSYEGVVMRVEVLLRAGRGDLLVNTQPRIGIDIQTSLRTAVLVAENFTGKSLRSTDVILTIRAEEDVDVVDGPSAGATITVAIIAAVSNRAINRTVFITGTINPDGSIGKIGGVIEKALAVAKVNASEFLVPKGQSKVIVYVPEESHPVPGVTIIVYRQTQVELGDYLKEKGFSTKVLEVANIREAYEQFAA